MDVRVKVVEPIFVASVRHIGPYNSCSLAWARLREILGAAELFENDAAAYGIFHDDPSATPPDECRMDACLTLPAGIDAHSPALVRQTQSTDLTTQHLGNGGEYACLLIKGPYTQIPIFYRYIFTEWFPKSGREFGEGTCFEAYYNDPAITKPEDLLSEIFISLKPIE